MKINGKVTAYSANTSDPVGARLTTDGTHGIKPILSFDSGLSGVNYADKAQILQGLNTQRTLTMALSEKTEFSSLTVLADGQINVRRDRVIFDGDVEISRQPHRWVLEPGQDVSDLPEHVQRVAKAVWDVKCVKDFKEKRAKQLAEMVLPGSIPVKG